MRKSTKVFLIISLVILVLGIVVTGVGVLIGGARWVSITWDNGLVINTDRMNSRQYFSQDISGPVQNLEIDANACQLTLVPSDSFQVYGMYDPNYWTLDISQPGSGKLVVQLTPNPVPINIGIHDTAQLTISYPANTNFSAVTVNANAVSADLGRLQADKLSLSFNAATVNDGQLTCHQLEFSMAAGLVNISSLQASQSALISMNAGTLTIQNAQLTALDFNMNAGSANLQGKLTADNRISVTAGDLKVQLDQPESDLLVTANVTAGSLTFNGHSVTGAGSDNQFGSTTAPVKINVIAQIGSVSIRTQ